MAIILLLYMLLQGILQIDKMQMIAFGLAYIKRF